MRISEISRSITSKYIQFASMRVHTSVIQKIRRQHRYRAQNAFKKSNFTHGKMKKHTFYQHVMFQLIWLSSFYYI